MVSVGGVDVKFVIVNTNSFVRISGRNCDLEVGGKEVWTGGDIKRVDGCVLDHEAGLSGLEDEPGDEKNKKDDEAEDEEASAEATKASQATLIVAVTLF